MALGGVLLPPEAGPGAQHAEADRGHLGDHPQAPARRRGAGGAGGAADLGRSRHRGGGAGDRQLPPHALRQGGDRARKSAPRWPRRSPPSCAPVALAAADSTRRRKPHVVLVVGVNGTGKTTTIGKLAQAYREQGLRAVLVAGDTFRAAAVEQLQIWGERTGAPVIAGAPNADAAGLAFDALTPGAGRGRRRAADRHRRAAAQQGRADGGAAQDHPRAAQAGRERAAFGAAGAGRHHRPERADSRCGCSRRWWT